MCVYVPAVAKVMEAPGPTLIVFPTPFKDTEVNVTVLSHGLQVMGRLLEFTCP